jgi:hypothetical protein
MKDPKEILQKAALRDEPVFVLRAQDVMAPYILRHYIYKAQKTDCDEAFLEELQQILIRFEKWQKEYRSLLKLPD